MRKTVKIKSDNPDHKGGYYVKWEDEIEPGEEIYGEEVELNSKPPEKPVSRKKRAG
jgi:hypothetical protein